jgi:hypothetical protein
MASYPPKKNIAFTISLPIVDADGDLVAGATTPTGVVAGADGVAVLGAFTATATPTDEGEGFYDIALTAAQMNFDRVAGVLKSATAGAKNTPFVIYTSVRQVDDLAFPVVSGRGIDVDATNGVEITANQAVNVTQWNGTIVATPTVAGVPEVDVTHWIGVAAATPTVGGVPEVDVTHFNGTAGTFVAGRPEVNTSHVSGTLQTAGDVIGDTNDIQARLPAALTADGNIKADTLRVGGTLQTAGDIIGDTNDIQARLPAALTADGNIKADTLRVGSTLQTAGDLAAMITVVDDFIDTEIATILAAVDTEVAAIKTRTDNLPEGVTKNAILNNFEFFMVDVADHVTGKTGLTVTAERSIDGAAFAACANAVTEVSAGVYKINLAATDTNGDTITLKFTSAGADATLIMIKTEA